MGEKLDGQSIYHMLIQIAVENGEFDVVLCPSDHMLAFAEYIEGIRSERDAALARVSKLEAALTPSKKTKLRHWGEYKFSQILPYHDVDNDDPDYSEEITVPWTTVKEIMKSIREHALSPKEGG